MPAATACPVSSGRSTSVSSAIDGAAMDVERVEAGPEVARDVGQARRIEQREHLVVLAPQLAQPLHGQRLGRDDQAALDRLRVQQAVHDQRRLDGLAEPDLVGEQPAHRHPGGGALGDVELVREQPHASAEERAEAAGLARRQQVQDVEARQEVFGVVDVAGGQPLEQRPVAPAQSLRLGHERVAGRGQPQRRAALWEVDDQHAALDCGDAAGAEIGVEAVGQVVPDGPGMHTLILPTPSPRRSGRREDQGEQRRACVVRASRLDAQPEDTLAVVGTGDAPAQMEHVIAHGLAPGGRERKGSGRASSRGHAADVSRMGDAGRARRRRHPLWI